MADPLLPDPPLLAATLIANPLAPALTQRLAAAAAAADGLGAVAGREVLAEGIAVDLLVYGSDPGVVEGALRRALGGAPVDVVVQAAAGRRKRLFLADMDSTMIEQECIDELADFAGLKPQVSAITERAMRGEIAFEPALRERVALLRGLPVEVIDRIIAERITLMPGGPALLATLKAHGVSTCLVSGGFTLFTGPVGARLGFDGDRANELLVRDGALTGEVAEPILGREAKLATLVALRDGLGLARADVMAVGDGANDLAMLAEAGLGIAYRAKPAVAAAAAARIDHADLTALLYCQGYRADEIVAA